MKRIAAGILAALLAVTNVNVISFAEEERYQELIGYLDEGDYAAARNYIDKLEEESLPRESASESLETNPAAAVSSEELLEVELTPDNFKDYFDIILSETEIFMDAFDEEISNYGNHFIFVNHAFRDGWIFMGTSDDFAIEADIQYLEGGREETIEIDFNGIALVTSSYSFSHRDSEDISITDFSVPRVKGTVFFAKEEAVDYFERVEDDFLTEGYEAYITSITINDKTMNAKNVIQKVLLH